MSVTIRDVARAAGVSTATVSKVINHSPSISQATIERVEDVIRQLDYRPNKRAQSFARKATRNILFLSELEHGVGFDNPHLFEMLAGAEAALARKDYGLLIKRINARELVNSFADIIDDEFVDGAIVHASVVSREVASLLTDTLFPYVVIGMPDFANRLCWIDTNNSVAGQIAASHLRKKGYERIAYIGGQKEDTISLHRLNGVLDALDTVIPAGYIRHGAPSSETGYKCTMELLELERRPQAIICANQYLAFGCVEALKHRGLSIPRQMAVITFDDFPFSKVLDPPLTVVNLDMYDMGEQAAKIVMRRIRNPQLLVQSYTTLPGLIERGSTKEMRGNKSILSSVAKNTKRRIEMFNRYLKKAISAVLALTILLTPALFAFPVRADESLELGPVTSKDVVYQIITDRFYDGDPTNNVPAGFDPTLFDGTGDDLKLYQGGD